MSLLIKALEKAEKDRQENAGISAPESQTPLPAQAQDLTLEPLMPSASSVSASHTPAPENDIAMRSLTRTPSAKPALSAQASPQAAAAIVRAGKQPENATLAWMRENPRTLFFSFIALFAVGYGAYLWAQIAHPAWFIKRAPVIASQPTTPVAPITVVSAPRTDAAMPATPTPAKPASTIATTQMPAPKHHAHRSAAATPAPTDTKANAGIAATPETTMPTPLDALLTQAWTALNAGHLDDAQQLYTQAQARDPNNTDVYLGLASIASQQGDISTATRGYMKVLELDPRNMPAQAGLLNLLGSADPAAAEAKLKQLIAQTPSPFLYSALANTYANQKRWAEAQQAYFEAYNRKPDNADYAYNLAVALEHINQPALAKNFYQRALVLTNGATQPAHFDTAVVQARLQKLSAK